MSRTTVALLFALGIAPALGAERLFPTDIQSLGDCVTPRITAPTNPLQARIDKAYCTENNAGDDENLQRCLDNTAARSEVTFFHDSCGSDTGPFVMSLGGIEYTLRKRESARGRVPVAGAYEGDGLQVTIAAGRLLRRSELSIEEGGDEEHEVFVTVRKDGSSHRIRGVFRHGH